MAEGKKVASAFGEVSVEDNATKPLENIQQKFGGFGDKVWKAGENLRGMGAVMTGVVTGPIVGLAAASVKMAADFDNSLTNISSVTGQTGDELKQLGRDLLTVGAGSVAGPQAVADAYYDVAGGVADASSRMAILQAAVALSEAGQADLGASTQGMISIMNSFGFSADKAGFAADVLTRTVAVGVGSMDEFVAAMGPIAGTVNAAGVSVEDFAAGVAFMTTKGMSASQAATGYRAAINSLLNPNAEMTKALKKAGIASASAAIEQDGLAATLAKVNAAVGESPDKLTAAMGSTEAYGAAVSLASKDFDGFAATMKDGIDGATEAARKLQMQGFNNQSAKLVAGIQAIGISIGEIFLPYLNQAVTAVSGFIQGIMAASPELLPLIVGIGAAVAAIGPLTFILGAILSPIGLLVAGVAALGAAFATNFLGIRDLLQPVLDIVGGVFNGILAGAKQFITDIQTIGLGATVEKWFNAGVDWLKNSAGDLFAGAVKQAISFATDLTTWFTTNAPNIQAGIMGWLGGATRWLSANAGTLVGNALAAAFKFTSDIGAWLIANAPSITAAVTGWFNAGVQWLKDNGPGIIEGAIKGAFSFANAATTAVGDFVGALGLAFTTSLPAVFGPGGSFETAISGVKAGWDGIFGEGGSLMAGFNSLFGDGGTFATLWNSVMGEGGIIGSGIETAKKFVQQFADKFTDVKTAITGAFQGVLKIILRPFAEALKKLGEMLMAVGWVAGVNVGDIGTKLVTAAGSIGSSYGEGPQGPPAPGRAHGGPGTAGQGYSVFDKGGMAGKNREVFVPKTGGSFIPLEGGGGNNVTNNWSVQVNGITDLGKALDQLDKRAGRRNKSIMQGAN